MKRFPSSEKLLRGARDLPEQTVGESAMGCTSQLGRIVESALETDSGARMRRRMAKGINDFGTGCRPPRTRRD